MHKEILNKQQEDVLNIVEYFSQKDFYLAGGTALALQIGHRESTDFDIFTYNEFDNQNIYKALKTLGVKDENMQVVIDQLDEYTLFINDVKFTFLRYPFLIKDFSKEDNLVLATPLSIATMKAYALGRRGKWKDYVDIYMLLQQYTLKDIINKAQEIFGTIFSEKMFLQQLCYFNDIDYTESVIWRAPNFPSDSEIKLFLEKIVTTDLLQK